MNRTGQLWGWLTVGLVSVAAVFQVFFRYAYAPGPYGVVYRMDRLGGAPCVAAPYDGCNGAGRLSPAPSAAPSSAVDRSLEAIDLARHQADLGVLGGTLPPSTDGYDWDAQQTADEPGVYFVSYADSSGAGWFWEVDTKQRVARLTRGNAVLERKYGIPLSATPAPAASDDPFTDALARRRRGAAASRPSVDPLDAAFKKRPCPESLNPIVCYAAHHPPPPAHP
jgi:hypothetical protein